MFSTRAHEYVIAYYMHEENKKADTLVHHVPHINKERKTHTDVKDICSGWVTSLLKDVIIM